MYFQGSEIRDGKIFAQNSGRCVEEHYEVAYNLGCGSRKWPGWINIDLMPGRGDLVADIRDLYTIASDSADAVAAIHVLEHFYRWEVPEILQEWKRILKPGGKLILELPCMDKVFAYVVQCIRKKEGLAPFMSLHALYGDPKHESPEMTHKYGYFAEELTGLLKAAGFAQIDFVKPLYHFGFRDMRFEAIK